MKGCIKRAISCATESKRDRGKIPLFLFSQFQNGLEVPKYVPFRNGPGRSGCAAPKSSLGAGPERWHLSIPASTAVELRMAMDPLLPGEINSAIPPEVHDVVCSGIAHNRRRRQTSARAFIPSWKGFQHSWPPASSIQSRVRSIGKLNENTDLSWLCFRLPGYRCGPRQSPQLSATPSGFPRISTKWRPVPSLSY